MKKNFLVVLAIVFVFPVMAQTNFRHITYKEAIAAAKNENKLVFMDFYTHVERRFSVKNCGRFS